MILVIIYVIAGYWAVNQTIYRNKVFIEFKPGSVFIRKVTYGAILGWILIPVALIRLLFGI